jgi:hypothetical protein
MAPEIKLKTNRDYLISINQYLVDFINKYESDKKEHSKEHKIIWKLLLGLPGLLVAIFTLILIFGGK